MKRLLLSMLAAPCLAATPLDAVNRALLGADAAAAWQALAASWPQLDSQAQRDSWQAALAALAAEHCGKDAPLQLPPWQPALTLELAQRDMPLARSYRVTLSGEGDARSAQLLDDHGSNLLAGARYEAEGGRRFRLTGPDLAAPLAGGRYRLLLQAGKQQWQVQLLLPPVANLGWLARQPLGVARLPPPRAACPAPWLEQSLLRRSDFALLWWQRRAPGEALRWPAANGEQWQSLALVQAEARGALVLRVVQRQVGPR
ncbi:hypothetical protein QF022_001750 [Vogesella perlucida]|nr:hypothetical protein [Vogesella perlucida]